MVQIGHLGVITKMAYRFTITLSTGREVDFESSNVEIEVTAGKVTKLVAAKKDNGLSLLFVDKSLIASIVRDSRKDLE